MQAAFVVLVLPGVAQRLLILRALPLRRAGHRLALQLAEGVVLPGPAQVVGVVAVVLFVQAVAPADQVAPGVVTVKQFLPVRQAVVGASGRCASMSFCGLRSPSRLSARSYTRVFPDWPRGVTADCLLYNKYLEY